MEAAGGAEATAAGDIGQGKGGEAQEIVDEAKTVGCAEAVAGLAGEAADEAAEVAVGAAEGMGDVFQAVLARRERLQKQVGGVEASRVKVALQRVIDGLAILVVVANLGKRRYIEVVEGFVLFFSAHFLETFAFRRWK